MQELVYVAEPAVRNEGKVKSYDSCTDARAWHSRGAVRAKYLRECINRNGTPQHIPTTVLVDIVRRMAPLHDDALKAYSRCKPGCKSKAFIDTLYVVCSAMEECLKSKECLRKYFDEEEFKSQYWPRDAALDMLRVIRIIWSAVVEEVLRVQVGEGPSSSKTCRLVKNIPTIATEWKQYMIRQTKHVRLSLEPNKFPATLQQPCRLCETIDKINKSIPAQSEIVDKTCEPINETTDCMIQSNELGAYRNETITKTSKSVLAQVEKKNKSCETFAENIKKFSTVFKQPCQCCIGSNRKTNKYVLVRVDNKDQSCQPSKDIEKENGSTLCIWKRMKKNKEKLIDPISECSKTITNTNIKCSKLPMVPVENKYTCCEHIQNSKKKDVKATNHKSALARLKHKDESCDPIAGSNEIVVKNDKFTWTCVNTDEKSTEADISTSDKSVSVLVKSRNESCAPIEELTKMIRDKIKCKAKCDKCISAQVKTTDNFCEPPADLTQVNLDNCKLKLENLEIRYKMQSCEINRLRREYSEIKLFLEETRRQKDDVSDELVNCQIKLNEELQKTEKVDQGNQMVNDVNKNPFANPCNVSRVPNSYSAGDVESEISIILDTSQNEHFRSVSLLQVLHKTNKPLLRQEIALGSTCKVEDPAEILSKVKKAFGCILKREFSKIKKQKGKKNDDQTEITATSEIRPTSGDPPSQPLPASSRSSSPSFGAWRFRF